MPEDRIKDSFSSGGRSLRSSGLGDVHPDRCEYNNKFIDNNEETEVKTE